jgi:tripartite-type tricarboxylate transporter receptor subunit TctC
MKTSEIERSSIFPRRVVRAVSVTTALAFLAFGAVKAGAQEVSYKGKRINAIIGYSPGGGTDAAARLLGRYMKNYLPGKPTMIFRNMPGNRGTVAADYVANRTAKDGTYWFAGANSAIDANMLRRKEVTYDPRKFRFFGGFSRGGSVVMVRKQKRTNFTDGSKKPVIVGTPDGSDTWAELLIWGSQYLDWNVKFVIGYPGTPSLMLAIQRGEIDMFGTGIKNMLDRLQKLGGYTPVAQIGSISKGKFVSRKGYENVPGLPVLLKGKLSGLAKKSFDYWVKSNDLDKWFFIAPGSPDKVLRIYRTAFKKTNADAVFIERSRKQFGPDFSSKSGDEILEMVALTAYPDEKVLNFLRNQKVKLGLPTEPLTQAEKNKLLAKLGIGEKVKTTLTKIKRGGRRVYFMSGKKEHKVSVSGRDTKVMIGGKKTKRSKLKPGMLCEIGYPGNGAKAMSIICK